MNVIKNNPVTAATLALASIAAVVGGVVVIVHPETLDFQHYLSGLSAFAIALGLVGVGRGAAKAGEHIARGSTTEADQGRIRWGPGSDVNIYRSGEQHIVPGGSLWNAKAALADEEEGDHFDGLPHHPITDPSTIPPDNRDLPHDHPARSES